MQRFCEEGGRWVTFLCEEMDGVSGVSDVDDHEQAQSDRRIECFSEDVQLRGQWLRRWCMRMGGGASRASGCTFEVCFEVI